MVEFGKLMLLFFPQVRETRTLLAGLLLSAMATYAILVYGGLLSRSLSEWASSFLWAASSAAAGIRCLLTARRQSTRQGKLGWNLLGLAALAWFAGILHLMGGMLVIPDFLARGTLGNFLYASFAPLFICGLFCLRIRFPLQALTLQRFCEMGIMLGTVLSCALVILYEPLLQTRADAKLVFFSILDPALFITATLLALSALWLQGLRHLMAVSALLFGAILIHTGSNLLYFSSILIDPTGPVAFRLELLWVAAFGLQYWAAFEQDQLVTDTGRQPDPPGTGLEALLPGILVFIGLLVVFAFRHQLSQPLFWMLAPLVLLSAALLLAREWASQRHSMSLLHDLRESNAFANRILAASPSVLFSCRPAGDFSLSFISGNAQLGIDQNCVSYGHFWPERVHPDDLRLVQKQLAVADPEDIPSIEYRLQRGDGSFAWVYQRLVASLDDRRQVRELVGSITDISALKDLEKRVQIAQKLEALGRLSGGIAHDFNNLLTSILGYVCLSLQKDATSGEIRENLREIGSAGERAASLTRQLLAFSRRQPLQLEVLDVGMVIAGMMGLLKRLIGEDFRLRFHSPNRATTIFGDRNQLEQVLMNLIINAADAMPAGGEIVVEADEVDSIDAVPDGRCRLAFPHAVITVRDTGCGMTEEVRERLFEPFFTTKPPGHGTGLGLATVHGIVRQHHGQIEVKSRPGAGTTFRVYLPSTDRRPDRPTDTESPQVVGGKETVLVVDDEAAIPRLVVRALEPAGYRVLTATTPAEALELARQRGRDIELLLTDLVLPQMNGRQLAKSFLEICPKTKVVYMSGYSDDLLVRRQVQTGKAILLQKPLSLEELSQVLRQVLDRSLSNGLPVCQNPAPHGAHEQGSS